MKSSDDEQKKKLDTNLGKFPELASEWQRKYLGLRVTHPAVQATASKVNLFASLYFENAKPPNRLVLAGPTGNGKTTMAKGIYRWASTIGITAVEKGGWKLNPPRASFWSWQSICDAMENGERKGFQHLIEPMLDDQMIVVDDIGAESDRFRSGKSLDALSYLLSMTQERNWLVITMNYGPREWAERFDARIEDRLLRDSIVCDMGEVPSWSRL